MWAYRLRTPEVFERLDVPAPDASSIPDGGVLLRVLAGGICGSDIAKFRGAKGANLGPRGEFLPGVPGFPMHEVVGEVVASRHSKAEVGDRVVGWSPDSTGLVEYLLTDGDQVCTYDDGVPPTVAVLIQSLACVLYALERVPVSGRDVVVLGVGPIGALFGHVAKTHGARHVTGVDPARTTELSPVLGFDEVIATTSGNWVARLSDSERPAVLIEAVGHQVSTLDHAIDGVAAEGTVLYFGIPDDDVYPINMESLMRKNIALIGGITRDRRRCLEDADRHLRDHPELYDAIVTHELEPEGVQRAYDLASRASAGRLKVVLSLA